MMHEQRTVQIGNRTFLIIELPKDARNIKARGNKISYQEFHSRNQIAFHDGKYKFIGQILELSESTCKSIVPEHEVKHLEETARWYYATFCDLIGGYKTNDYLFEITQKQN